MTASTVALVGAPNSSSYLRVNMRTSSRRLAAALGLALSWATSALSIAPVASAAPSLPKIPRLELETYRLENGLQIVLHPDHRTPIVATNVWYHVGSKDDPPHLSGMAHLFEHLMLQGSRNVGEDMFFKYLERAGVSDRNATTGFDRTNYFETLPRSELPLSLWLESDRMGFLLDHLNDESLRVQRDVVKNELRQNMIDAPYGRVFLFGRQELYPAGHPYHQSIIGLPADLDAVDVPAAKAFYERWYAPGDATLVLAGDFDPKTARELVDTYFSTLPPREVPKHLAGPLPSPMHESVTLTVEADVALGRLLLAWAVPAQLADGDAALEAIGRVLSSRSSRLRKKLVHELHVASEISARHDYLSWQHGRIFWIDVALTAAGAGKFEVVRAAVDAELARLRKEGPSEGELSRARQGILSRRIFGLERVTERADVLNDYAHLAGTPDYLEQDLARYLALTAVSVRDAVRAHLPEGPRVIELVKPTKGAAVAGAIVERVVSAKAVSP